MNSYTQFLRSKRDTFTGSGITVAPDDIHLALFGF